jgi:hypothetical protein
LSSGLRNKLWKKKFEKVIKKHGYKIHLSSYPSLSLLENQWTIISVVPIQMIMCNSEFLVVKYKYCNWNSLYNSHYWTVRFTLWYCYDPVTENSCIYQPTWIDASQLVIWRWKQIQFLKWYILLRIQDNGGKKARNQAILSVIMPFAVPFRQVYCFFFFFFFLNNLRSYYQQWQYYFILMF